MNCAIYARYSTDLQNQASIEDQLRLCRERAAGEGWPILECYTDAAISGASLMRPGIQQLMQDAMAGRFQIILAEALDRLSRNLADIAGLYQRLTFAGVQDRHPVGGRDHRSPYRSERDHELPAAEGPGRESAPGIAGQGGGRQIRGREQLRL